MKRRIASIISAAVMFSGIILFSGCSVSGPAFTRIDEIPKQKAVIFLYRPSSCFGGAVSYKVWQDGINNNNPFVTIKPGGYFPYYADQGKVVLKAKTEAEKSITVDVVAGKTYYVLCDVSVGILVGRPSFKLIENEKAEKEIQKCKLLPALN